MSNGTITETKKWWQSKGVIGGALCIICAVLLMVVMKTSPADTIDKVVAEKSNLEEMGLSIITLISGILALWGRLSAKKNIG